MIRVILGASNLFNFTIRPRAKICDRMLGRPAPEFKYLLRISGQSCNPH
jgi:hypothetical protein